MSATRFVAEALGLLPCPPPNPTAGVRCWLCAGPCIEPAWRHQDAIAPTFTQHNCARCPDSGVVCQPCASLTRAETFQAMVRNRGLEIKLWTQAGWHSYSHLIISPGHYEAPKRARMREVTLQPPVSDWLMGLNTSGKKHTIFRGFVARGGADRWPVQIDEQTVWLDAGWRDCLGAIEAMTAASARREEACSGVYHPETPRRIGPSRWRTLERACSRWREARPDWIALAAIVADGPPLRDKAPEQGEVEHSETMGTLL